ncbi:putative peptide transporter ptr2 [Mycena chlorophos]|uniref:Putative peptide transporter ptr2 n=1 Tax=Mycena chlorophos TaxID=658473 RepID=A0A8H6S157_MYCCL|nr:putative peptide transporter ptr2 [Mycena chlorophos]
MARGYNYQPLNATEDEVLEQYELQNNGTSTNLHEPDGIHDGLVCPTEEERSTLRRVPDAIPWSAYLIAIVELAERFSFYGAGVVFTNFIQYPLPVGSHTGAGMRDGQSGALGKGQRSATGITTLYQFWCYVTPFLGAYIADVYLGRFATVSIAVFIALAGHAILIVAALPGVIEKPDTSLLFFLVALVVMGLGTGLFKANIAPLVGEQYRRTKLFVAVTERGEKVLVDPALTVSRIYLYFYLMINIGSLVGQIGMTYSEKYVGFWLAYTLPTIVFLLCPLILLAGRKRYASSQRPTGESVLVTFARLVQFAWRRSSFGGRGSSFWDAAKPSTIALGRRPEWMTFDDAWVDEVRRGVDACRVFMWFPVYWLAMGQMNSNLTSQAATMTTDGLPNDILSNIDPLALIIFIPLFDFVVYPALQQRGIRFTPLKKIILGFFTAAFAMVHPEAVELTILQTSPCGTSAATCKDANGQPLVSPISVWVQAPAYVSAAFVAPEIFASVTGLEFAYTRAPANMRSLVMSLYMGTSAVSALLAEAFLGLSADPFLVWNYSIFGVMAALGGASLWWWASSRGLDREEDEQRKNYYYTIIDEVER